MRGGRIRTTQESKPTKGKSELEAQIQAEAATPQSAALHPRVRRHTGITSQFLAGERDVWIYLPPGYEHSERRYPLLILQDGQNLFDPETAFIRGRTWRVAEHADEAIDSGEVEPLVIAGVANAGE